MITKTLLVVPSDDQINAAIIRLQQIILVSYAGAFYSFTPGQINSIVPDSVRGITGRYQLLDGNNQPTDICGDAVLTLSDLNTSDELATITLLP